MLELLGYGSLDALIDATVPEAIRLRRPLNIHAPMSEHEALANMRAIANRNQVARSYIGLGYYDTITPPVIRRNATGAPAGTRPAARMKSTIARSVGAAADAAL